MRYPEQKNRLDDYTHWYELTEELGSIWRRFLLGPPGSFSCSSPFNIFSHDLYEDLQVCKLNIYSTLSPLSWSMAFTFLSPTCYKLQVCPPENWAKCFAYSWGLNKWLLKLTLPHEDRWERNWQGLAWKWDSMGVGGMTSFTCLKDDEVCFWVGY